MNSRDHAILKGVLNVLGNQEIILFNLLIPLPGLTTTPEDKKKLEAGRVKIKQAIEEMIDISITSKYQNNKTLIP